jgi:hypothetical protein
MWKAYAPYDGVVIKSTVDKLAEVTKNDRFLVYWFIVKKLFIRTITSWDLRSRRL